MPSKYPVEFGQPGVCLLQEMVPGSELEYGAIRYVASRLGFAAERLCGWNLAAQVDAGDRALGRRQLSGEEIRRLHAENYGVYGTRKMHGPHKTVGTKSGTVHCVGGKYRLTVGLG